MPRPKFETYDPNKKKPAVLAPESRGPEERKSGAIDASKLNENGREPRPYQRHGYSWI
jgi:hypothetical protein